MDAVYRPADTGSSALVDQIAEALQTESTELARYSTPVTTGIQQRVGTRRPLLADLRVDAADVKVMTRDDFIKITLRPFFTQLSMYAYEATYTMSTPDVEQCRRDLVEDIVDEGTIV